MKKIYSIFMAVALFVAGVTMTGCQKDNNDPEQKAEAKTYKMSIKASMGADDQANGQRKVLGLDGNTLNATWAIGEKVTVYNETKGAALGGYLEAQEAGASTTLLGELSGEVETGDLLTLKFCSPNYAAQAGTLDYISANCDYAVAENVEVSSVDGETIYTEQAATFANQQAIVKFTLQDAANSSAISASELVVELAGATYTITPAAAASELFVALPACSAQDIALTATVGTDTYTYEKTGVSFANGQYYPITVKMNKHINYLGTPLTLEATSNGRITITNPKSGMKYSKNGGAKVSLGTSTTNINVVAGDKLQFYGNGTSINNYNGTRIGYGTTAATDYTTATHIIYGNVMSLVDENNYDTNTTLLTNQVFQNLFSTNEFLTDISNLKLPATTLTSQCYRNMFSYCANLTTIPADLLPATNLAAACYDNMFFNSGLQTIPEGLLPTTTLADNCYYAMFSYCANLTTIPADLLPATTLAAGCYRSMFDNCSSLTTSPVLPAPTLVIYCYAYMFRKCTNLKTITCLATNVSNSNCVLSWMSEASSTGTFYKASGMSADTWRNSSIVGLSGVVPSGWTIVNY